MDNDYNPIVELASKWKDASDERGQLAQFVLYLWEMHDKVADHVKAQTRAAVLNDIIEDLSDAGFLEAAELVRSNKFWAKRNQ